MRALRLALVAGLFRWTAFGLAVPVSADYHSLLFTRGQEMCSNIPNVKAGTKTPTYPTSPVPRSLAATVLSRGFPAQKITFCASACLTYNVFQSLRDPDFGDLQQAMIIFLVSVYQQIRNTIAQRGDGVMQNGRMYAENTEGWLKLFLGNANNHQLTLGVAAAAVQAMATFMQQAGAGPISWQIWDGVNQVGRGGLQIHRPPPR